MLAVTGCRGIMIGRAALSRPWLFRDAWSYLTTGTIPETPSIEQKVQLMRKHFDAHAAYRSERSAALEFRKRVSWYAKEMNPCRLLRDEMRLIDSAADFENVLRRFLDWRHTHDAISSHTPGQSVPAPSRIPALSM